MANTFLTVPFKDKDAAKALGARWDSAQRLWFVPDGRELSAFATWLPAGAVADVAPASVELTPILKTVSLLVALKKGVSLSSLLAGVSKAVSQAYLAGVWTLVEVVELRASGGHVFLGVSERDANGVVLAKTSAVIWQSTANSILPEFERETGAQLATGIKLLVRARPVFKSLHGFSIEIDAIDSQYTLGDLEARKREIRERLQLEGVFSTNRQLPSPWDFNDVLVVAPAGGAGLGDFQAEANMLEQFGVCRFVYAFSRFQGEGAAREICDVLQNAIARWGRDASGRPDAVVIIRGGGAVNDLAWLNDYDLARLICDLPVPVLTGIGHERDSTVLDEVANARFDTPSKVIAGIEQLIGKRSAEAKANFEMVVNRASQAIQAAKADAGMLERSIRSDCQRHLSMARQVSKELISEIRIDSMASLRSDSEHSRETFQAITMNAANQINQAKRDVPMFYGEIVLEARHAIRSGRTDTGTLMVGLIDQAGRDVQQARTNAQECLSTVETSAKQMLREAAAQSEALMREITGQGPAKTLGRGFAMVRTLEGQPVTRASKVPENSLLEIQFSDGKVAATAGKHI